MATDAGYGPEVYTNITTYPTLYGQYYNIRIYRTYGLLIKHALLLYCYTIIQEIHVGIYFLHNRAKCFSVHASNGISPYIITVIYGIANLYI